MRLEEQVFLALTGPSPQLPVGMKVYPNVAAENAVAPYVVITRISTTPANALRGRVGLDRVRLQVDVYASTLSEAASISHTIRDILEALKTDTTYMPMLEDQSDDWDSNAELYLRSSDYFCWERI